MKIKKENLEEGSWAATEFEGADLGDVRLSKRLVKIVDELSNQPERPINHASEDAAATAGAYRFFQNDKCSSAAIFAPHHAKTLGRLNGHDVVLCNQDTTSFNYTNHGATSGLGPIGDKKSNAQGILLHSCLAVTPEGLPLGLLGAHFWVREGHLEKAEKNKNRPIEEKESFRWVEMLDQVEGIPNAVIQGDRENDIYEFLCEANSRGISFNIRSCNNRKIKVRESKKREALLNDTVAKAPCQATIELEVPKESRIATLEICFGAIEILAPQRLSKKNHPATVSCWFVNAREINVPAGCTKVSWTLLTNVAVESLEDAFDRLTWYRRRWTNEELHKIMKSGCKVEECRLGTASRLENYLTMFLIIAWRLFWMVHIGRTDPNAPATVVLTRAEIGALSNLERFKGKIPKSGLKVKRAITLIGCLGGYLNRKNDPPPGATVLWRGWQRLTNMAELFASMELVV